jgi:hypothetical protein
MLHWHSDSRWSIHARPPGASHRVPSDDIDSTSPLLGLQTRLHARSRVLVGVYLHTDLSRCQLASFNFVSLLFPFWPIDGRANEAYRRLPRNQSDDLGTSFARALISVVVATPSLFGWRFLNSPNLFFSPNFIVRPLAFFPLSFPGPWTHFYCFLYFPFIHVFINCRFD